MGQEILTKEQQRIIELIVSEPNLADFYLTGGTALAACYFNHRFSEDLDFFVYEEPDKIFLHSFAEKIKKEVGASEMRYERLYDRNQFYFKIESGEELKIEFTKYPFKQLENRAVFNGIKTDSLRDVSANKLMALLDRFDPKDFVDLFFILQKFKLEDVRSDAENKFDIKIDNIFLGGEFAKSRNIFALPKMLKPLNTEELKDFFSDKAKELGYGIFIE